MSFLKTQSGLHPDTNELVKEDAVRETKIHRVIYEYLRRGNMDDAIRFCEGMGQPWRAAILSGGVCFESSKWILVVN